MTTEPNTHIKRMCKVLTLHRSSYYKWGSTCETRMHHMCADAVIGAKIKAIFHDEAGLYGSKFIAAVLNEDHAVMPINHNKVAQITKILGLKDFSTHRRCVTTMHTPGYRVIPDLVGRNFTATATNRVYVDDIT